MRLLISIIKKHKILIKWYQEKLKLESNNSSEIDLKNIVSNYCSVFTPNEKIEF